MPMVAMAESPGLEPTETRANFGSPSATENTLRSDGETSQIKEQEGALEKWFQWKENLASGTGFSFGLDYNIMALGTDNSSGEDTAAGGVARIFGAWELYNRGSVNSGRLVWKFEHRHKYTDVAPNRLALDELGNAGLLAPTFSDVGFRISNFYWGQTFNDGKSSISVGYLDVTDYLDVFLGGSPWTGFSNFAFGPGSSTIFLPEDGTLGLAGGTMLDESFYVVGGITNAFSDPEDPFSNSFDRFFNDGEFFKSLEIGYTTEPDRIYFDNTHLTLWHVDSSSDAGTDEGHGAVFTHVRYINDSWAPFVRGGYADGGGALLEKSLSAGVLYQPDPTGDLAGFGINWGEPNEDVFGSGLKDQVTVEAFYRFQLTGQIAVTADVQYLNNSALSPTNEDYLVFGIRTRFAF